MEQAELRRPLQRSSLLDTYYPHPLIRSTLVLMDCSSHLFNLSSGEREGNPKMHIRMHRSMSMDNITYSIYNNDRHD